MGIGKEKEERIKEIIDVAEELFTMKGYDSTSTTDILERVGIARGTLYYHFKSKEEILDALIDRIVQAVVCNIHSAIADKKTASQKLIAFVGSIKVDSAIGKEFTENAHKPQNVLMHQKMQNALLTILIPIASEIIRDGIKDGSFSTNYPEEVAEMLLIYSSVVFDGVDEVNGTEFEKKAVGFIFNMERLLGIKQGVLLENVRL